MGLETGTYIDSLVATNPVGATDPKSQGDDHIRLLKSTILASFPNITGAMTLTHTELNNALQNNISNTINFDALPATPNLELTGNRPLLVWDEDDAAADEGRWYGHVSAGSWSLVAINDANNSSSTAIQISRTGTVIDRISLDTGDVRIVEPGGDYLSLEHNATNAVILSSAGRILLTANSQIVRLVGDADDVTLELYVNSAVRGTLSYIEADSDLVLDSDGGFRLQLNNTDILNVDSGGGIVTPDNDADEFGYKGAPHNEQNGNYTLVLTDAGKKIYKASGGAGETITIPANATVAFPVGTIIVIGNDGGGDLTIAITTDTLEPYGGTAGSQTLGDNQKATIEKVTSTLWKYSATG